MTFLGLSNQDKENLSLEVVPYEARLKLTRLIRSKCKAEEPRIELIRQNQYINIANTVMKNPIYRLNSDEWGEYEPAEYAWHAGEIELIMRLPSTIEIVAIIADFIQNDMLDITLVNRIIKSDNCSFKFKQGGDEGVSVSLMSIDKIPADDISSEHKNIRLLVSRMETCCSNSDPSGVLHASASIFETLAKDVISDQNIENKPLGSFFDKYRNESRLPKNILDSIISVYKERNTTPLAGHGGTNPTTITQEDAIVLVEMTKAFVRAERQLRIYDISAKTNNTETPKK